MIANDKPVSTRTAADVMVAPFHRPIGVAGLERLGIGRGARLEAKARNLAHDLAVPLGELERRNVGGKLDRRVVGEHVLQEANPRLANAGLAVRQTNEVRPDRGRYRTEHGLGVGQRDTTDEMYDRMLAVGVHARPLLSTIPIRDSPDETETGINVRVCPALLQDRREVLTATRTSGNPNTWSGSDLAIFPGIWTQSFCRLLLNA